MHGDTRGPLAVEFQPRRVPAPVPLLRRSPVTLDERLPVWEHCELLRAELNLGSRRTKPEERARRIREIQADEDVFEEDWGAAFRAAAGIPRRQMPDEDRPGIDRRCYGVDGERTGGPL